MIRLIEVIYIIKVEKVDLNLKAPSKKIQFKCLTYDSVQVKTIKWYVIKQFFAVRYWCFRPSNIGLENKMYNFVYTGGFLKSALLFSLAIF